MLLIIAAYKCLPTFNIGLIVAWSGHIYRVG